MSTRRSSVRRREKPPFQRLKDHCRKFTAFMFSNVGIILLVIFYTIGGAFIFQGIEIEYDSHRNNTEQMILKGRNYTEETLTRIWEEASRYMSFDDPHMFKKRVNEILLDYQRQVVHKQMVLDIDVDERWSFSAAFLYSLTVITTIGYGNISPRSDWGKLVTILYAMIGMPLFLLYLSNIGDLFAKSFKWIYSKVCLCRICPGVARRRLVRERIKIKELTLNRALADMESARNSKYTSSDSTTDSASTYGSEDSGMTSSSSSRISDRRAMSLGVDVGGLIDDDEVSEIEREIKQSTDEITVPLTVCIFIMISYIVWGALLFQRWEEWKYLDGSYFCFISLTSIGFGDLVPGEGLITKDKDKVKVSFILCAVYLLLGMALIAMCFNLMQEQVIHNMRAIKRAFKACFRCRRS